MVIISSYPASPRRITVLVNFQAILSIFSGETSSNRDIFFTEDAAKKFFPTSKISAQEIRHQFFLIWSNLAIMAHIMGLGYQSESWQIIVLSLTFTNYNITAQNTTSLELKRRVVLNNFEILRASIIAKYHVQVMLLVDRRGESFGNAQETSIALRVKKQTQAPAFVTKKK